MKLIRLIIIFAFCCLTLFSVSRSQAAEWQWSVPIRSIISTETNSHPTAFLWIPPNCRQVRGVVFGQHNMLEEGIFEHQAFRKTLSDIGFAEIWVSPNLSIVFDFNGETEKAFLEMMQSLADLSGYQELKFAPIIPIGHSALASLPWNFGAALPERTLAMISIHGDSPLSNLTGSGKPNPDWKNRNINGIPGLLVIGEYEWMEERLQPAFSFIKNNPQSTIALLADAGHGHFDFSDELVDFLCMFIRKSAKERLPAVSSLDMAGKLKSLDPQSGWIVDRWRINHPLQAAAAPFQKYKGNREESFWAFDKEMALATQKYYDQARGKTPQYIGYCQNGKLLSGAGPFKGFSFAFIPQNDGLTFNISAAFIDTTQGKKIIDKHALGKISINRICGPIQKINDTTFSIRFYRMGLNNPKRTGDVWLMASNKGDKVYKSTVQQAEFKIPLRNEIGEDQKIDFPFVQDQNVGVKFLKLEAKSSSDIPVYYYVKEGPAEINEDTLKFTKIPPRAKFPIKVTVVAWQYGRSISPKLKSAIPIERSFMIIN